MKIGVDIGYSYTKDNYGHIFKSAMMDSPTIGGMQIDINGKSRIIGAGYGTTDVNKAGNELTIALLLTALYLNGAGEYKIITGLPILQFKKQKDELRQSVLKYRDSVVNGKNIHITDVQVYSQCAGALLSIDYRQSCTVVDIGGRTTDIGLFIFENGGFVMKDCSTLYVGMESLFSEIVSAVNERYELSVEPWQGESILKNGLAIGGIQQDIKFLDTTLKNHCEPICKELVLRYSVRSLPVLLCGGGAIPLKPFIKACAPSVGILNDSQFSNAKGFYIRGCQIYA